jgi:hypothetical protein
VKLVDTDGLPKATYAEIDELVEFAKEFIIIVGHGYTGMTYRSDERPYYLTEDAERNWSSRRVRRSRRGRQSRISANPRVGPWESETRAVTGVDGTRGWPGGDRGAHLRGRHQRTGCARLRGCESWAP